MDYIRIKKLDHCYQLGKVEIPALKDINLDIKKGEMLALVGPSGSGKTTLINLIGTLDKPTRGEIIVDSIVLNELTPKEQTGFRKNKISFIFQFFNLFPTLNLHENIEFPLLFSKIPSSAISRRVNAAIEMVGLQGMEKRGIDEISGGQRQRIAIARALVTLTPIILADEPTGNLDGENAYKVMDLMKEINKKYGTTIIFTTHDPRVMKYADRIVELKDGQIQSVQ